MRFLFRSGCKYSFPWKGTLISEAIGLASFLASFLSRTPAPTSRGSVGGQAPRGRDRSENQNRRGARRYPVNPAFSRIRTPICPSPRSARTTSRSAALALVSVQTGIRSPVSARREMHSERPPFLGQVVRSYKLVVGIPLCVRACALASLPEAATGSEN